MKSVNECFSDPTSRRWIIGEKCQDGLSKSETFGALLPLVENQVKPFVFTYNPGGGQRRQPKAMADQIQMFQDEIGRVFQIMGRADNARFDSPEIQASPVEIETPRPVASGKKSVRDEIDYFLTRVEDCRKFLTDREAMSREVIDSLGMRPAEAAGVLIPAGIPADACLHAMTISWPKDARDTAGIRDFNVTGLSKTLAENHGIDIGGKDENGQPYHPLFGYVLTLISCRQPVFLVGPMGTGKSYAVKQAAAHLGLTYSEASMSGATRSDLLGRQTVNPEKPFIPSHLSMRYQTGGVFNFEEMDSAVPDVLNILNNAIANQEFFNTSNGEVYAKHPDFVVCATGNTWGTGATRLHVARDKQDGAALDRFRMGRVYVALDRAVERMVAMRNV